MKPRVALDKVRQKLELDKKAAEFVARNTPNYSTNHGREFIIKQLRLGCL